MYEIIPLRNTLMQGHAPEVSRESFKDIFGSLMEIKSYRSKRKLETKVREIKINHGLEGEVYLTGNAIFLNTGRDKTTHPHKKRGFGRYFLGRISRTK